MQGFPKATATRHDIENLLADASAHAAALAHLQCLMDERYQFDVAGVWGVVEPNGLTRLGLTAAEAVAMGAADRVVGEPARIGPTLEEVKSAACVRLNAKRDAIEYGVFTDSHGVRYDVDAKGREKMTGLTSMLGATGVALPAGFTWTTADNTEQPHNAETFLGLTSEILFWTDSVHRVCVAAKGSVRSSETVAAVLAAESAAAWPG